MRFTQISFIGVLSSLQGCTKETPVPQLQSQSPTSLDASSSSTTISSAPNSLRSSHQSKSAPSTSNSANIEESVNESSQIVSSTNKSSNDGDSDHISIHRNDDVDTTVHTRFNPEVRDMSEQLTNGITDETVHVPTTQVNRGSNGIPTVNNDHEPPVIGEDNLDIPPINRDVLPTSENGNNVEIIGERTTQVNRGSNGIPTVNNGQQSSVIGVENLDISAIIRAIAPHAGSDPVDILSSQSPVASTNNSALEEDHENSGNDVNNGSNGTPTVNNHEQPSVIGVEILDIQSIIDAENASPVTIEAGNNEEIIGGPTDGEHMNNSIEVNDVDEGSNQDRHSAGSQNGTAPEINSDENQNSLNTSEVLSLITTTENGVDSIPIQSPLSSVTSDSAPELTVEELNQERQSIIQRLGGTGLLINGETTREECEGELALIRDAIDEARTFNERITQLVPEDPSIHPVVNIIAEGTIRHGESRFNSLERRIRQFQ